MTTNTAAHLVSEAKIRVEIRSPAAMAADPSNASHWPDPGSGRQTMLQCASGGHSALTTGTRNGLGFGPDAHRDGGLKAWRESGLGAEAGS